MANYDVAVIGLGGMGAAALYHLARRGARVIGLERHALAHRFGSSHGLTRLLRVAYAEGSSYVPLVKRARDLWIELSAASGETIFHQTGHLELGRADCGSIVQALASCRDNDLTYTLMDADETMRRYPAWRLPADFVALHQPDAGFVRPEAAILAHVGLAISAGADVRIMTEVVALEPTAHGSVRVRTADGVIEAGQVIVAAGAWVGELLPAVKPVTEVRRIPIGWFATRRPDLFSAERFPIWTLEADEGSFYGAPIHGHPGVKIGGPSSSSVPGRWVTEPDVAERGPLARDEPGLRAALDRYLPEGAGPALDIHGCLVTFTPDEHFLIDRLPDQPSILVASPCSGHGFKFASVVGEICADLALEGTTRHPIDGFKMKRFSEITAR
jgi:sarcosine oxidase